MDESKYTPDVLTDLREAAARKWQGDPEAQRAGLFARAADEVERLRAENAELRQWEETHISVRRRDTQALAELRRKVEALEEGAARYRLLRSEAYEAVIPHGGRLDGKRTAWITKLHPGDSFDAAIDAALAASDPQRGSEAQG